MEMMTSALIYNPKTVLNKHNFLGCVFTACTPAPPIDHAEKNWLMVGSND